MRATARARASPGSCRRQREIRSSPGCASARAEARPVPVRQQFDAGAAPWLPHGLPAAAGAGARSSTAMRGTMAAAAWAISARYGPRSASHGPASADGHIAAAGDHHVLTRAAEVEPWQRPLPPPAPHARHAMAYVLAGGRGSRLMELTDRRAKPAVYFGGKSRIIDFALSNALNSGIRRIGVATQYKAHTLIRHLQRGWNFFRAGAQRELRHPAREPARLGRRNGTRAPPMRCIRTSTSSRPMRRNTW